MWLFPKPIFILYWSVDTLKVVIYAKQLTITDEYSSPPDELQTVITADAFSKSRYMMRVICATAINVIIFRNVVRALKVSTGYIPWAYNLFEGMTASPVGKVAIFSFTDIVLSRIIFLPIAVLFSQLVHTRQSMSMAELLFRSCLQILILAVASGISTYAFISIMGKFGVSSILWLCPLINIFAAVAIAFYVHVMVPALHQPVPDGPLRTSLLQLSERIGFPLTRIIIMPSGINLDTTASGNQPNVYYTKTFGPKMILISEQLITDMNAIELTAMSAHELGHWKKNHTLKHIIISCVGMAAYCVVVIFSYDSNWVLSMFGAEGLDAPPGLSTVLVMSYVWPVLKEVITSIQTTVARSCEYPADEYAVSLGYRRPLVSALVKLSKYCGYPYAHSMYSNWFVGQPTIIERIRRINERRSRASSSR